MANLQIRIDETLKQQAQEVAESMGLELGQAVRLFLTQMIRCNGLPFRPEADPFFKEKNQRHLTKVYKEIKAGKNIQAHDLVED